MHVGDGLGTPQSRQPEVEQDDEAGFDLQRELTQRAVHPLDLDVGGAQQRGAQRLGVERVVLHHGHPDRGQLGRLRGGVILDQPRRMFGPAHAEGIDVYGISGHQFELRVN